MDWRAQTGRRVRLTVAVAVVAVVAACGGSSRPVARPPSRTVASSPAIAPSFGDRPPPGFVPATASFPTAQVGYAWGIAPCVHDHSLFCPGFVGTTNGGARWSMLTAPAGLPTDPFRRAILRFSDPSNGWAVFNGIQVTHDGGVSWHRTALPGIGTPRVADIETGVDVTYVAASDATVAGSPIHLFVASADSDVFTQVPGVELDASGAAVSISLSSDGHGYLTGNAVGGASRLYALAIDGQWVTRPNPCPASATATVAAGPDNQATVVCDGTASSDSAPKTAWRSTDAARSFRRIAAPPDTGFTKQGTAVPDPPPPLPTATPGPTATGSPSAAAASANSDWGQAMVFIASAKSDRIYLTENGGTSWTVAFASSADASGSGLGIADLQFSDPTHGIVVLGDAGLYLRDRAAGRHLVQGPRLLTTRDGGRHWSQTVITEG